MFRGFLGVNVGNYTFTQCAVFVKFMCFNQRVLNSIEMEMNTPENKNVDESPLFKESCRNRFVGFLDILGFREWVARLNAREVFDRLRTLQEIKEVEVACPHLDILFFSDSILIFSDDDSVESFEEMLLLTYALMSHANGHKILIKGAISFGECTVVKGKNIHFGPSIIDSYLLQEELKVASVVLHHTAEAKLVEQEFNRVPRDLYVKDLDTCLKTGSVPHTHVYWFKNLSQTADWNRFYSDHALMSSGYHRLYLKNTLNLLKSVCER